MYIFYSGAVTHDLAILTGDELIHCSRVLRKKTGDTIFITDGLGTLFEARILTLHKTAANCQITSVVKKESPVHNWSIGITPTKNPGRLEWFAEKATEIGISELILFYSERSERKNVNTVRLSNIMISAMKQSGNLILPTVVEKKSTDEALRYCQKYKRKFIAYCGEECQYLPKIKNKVKEGIVLIGPEGDFTETEVRQAEAMGFIPVSLGQSRLRTETAALVALVMLHLG